MDEDGSLARRRRFEALAAEVYGPIQRYTRRRVDAHAVDDVVSETLLTLWRRLEDVPADAQLPWVYGVARRHIANHRRSNSRRLRLVHRAQSEPPPAETTDTPLDLELDVALAALGESDRELLRLWAWEQLEPAEIALVLGLSANAVSIRLHRAKKKLAQQLQVTGKIEVPSGHSDRESGKEGRR